MLRTMSPVGDISTAKQNFWKLLSIGGKGYKFQHSQKSILTYFDANAVELSNKLTYWLVLLLLVLKEKQTLRFNEKYAKAGYLCDKRNIFNKKEGVPGEPENTSEFENSWHQEYFIKSV